MNLWGDSNAQIFSHEKMFSSYIACYKQLLTLGYVNLKKYFLSLQWHKEKTFKHLDF